MKKLFIILFTAGFFNLGITVKKAAAADYFIYVKPGDKQFFQTRYKNTVSISYICKCYVNSTNLSFICADDTKFTTYKPALPPQYISMQAFAQLALKKSKVKKNADLNNARIYIVENYLNKYRYFQVKFYTS